MLDQHSDWITRGMRFTGSMSSDEWQIDRLDLDGYLARLGVAGREPTLEALAELHEAHVRTYTFDNIDVLLGRPPGVSLDEVQQKFVVRGRGGYCFEHSTIVAPPRSGSGTRCGVTWAGSVTPMRVPSRDAPTWSSR